MSGFTHLHVHTQYSLLDGAARIKELVTRCKELGMDSIAITDHGVMYGVIEFYKECRAQGVKPIIGYEAYVAPNMNDRTNERDASHLILIAKNEAGYHNLVKLTSAAFVDGFYYKPRIDYELLSRHSEGVICTSACLAGDIPQYLLHGRDDEARKLASRLKGIFGDDFYIELQNHGIPEQLQILPKLVALGRELDIKLIATNDVHYVNKADAETQDVLLCIQTQRYLDEEDRMRMDTDEFYLKSPEEMTKLFGAYPEAISNTAEIAAKCELEIGFGERRLPAFTAPDGMDNETYLRSLCETGMQERMPDADGEIWDRLNYELSVISNMGFVDYFLIVWDFVNFAHRNGIMVGPGRGSGAASLVAYVLKITGVDPIKYDLVFERFLNPERVSMPDFDIDFCIERRHEVIEYVTAKYGKDHCAQIITFGTLAARAAIKDVGRALRIPPGEVNRITKLVPNVLGITIDGALEQSPELKALYDSDPQMKKLIDISKKLEGLPRNVGMHAAGLVISSAPITEFVPLQRGKDAITTQFPKETVEELGLLKIDLLGLRNLTAIRDTLDLIRYDGKDVPDLDNLVFDDPGVYAMISDADTDGIFQLESPGMRRFMSQLKPDNIEDIIAGISLFRPGPMESIPRYLAGKENRSNVTYINEKLRPILSNTYGCMVYQEQVMQIVRDIAGYSWGRSDMVRRAMAKKKHEAMQKEREYFISGITENGVVTVPGAVRNGVPRQQAVRIFEEMSDFASYAFNKAHAAGYAFLAYQTAYLKLYYPVEFFTALINSLMGSTEKISAYISSCKAMGIRVLPPDINKSRQRFMPENGAIRFGLAAIRNVGEGAMDEIIEERLRGGEFVDFFDFVRRSGNVNKRMVEGLIKAGCFDSLGARRSQLMAVYDRAMEGELSRRKHREQGQLSLFDIASPEVVKQASVNLPELPEFAQSMLLSMEKEATGIYVSGHPLAEYAPVLDKFTVNAALLSDTDGIGSLSDGDRVTIGGIITAMKMRATKSGSGMMGTGTLEDLTGAVEIAIFPANFTKFRAQLPVDSKVIVSGRLSMREDQKNSVLVDDVKPLELPTAQVNRRLYLRLDCADVKLMDDISKQLARFPGNIQVVLFDPATKVQKLVPRELYIAPSDAVLDILRTKLGDSNVILKDIAV